MVWLSSTSRTHNPTRDKRKDKDPPSIGSNTLYQFVKSRGLWCFAQVKVPFLSQSVCLFRTVCVFVAGILQHPDGTVLKQLQPAPRGPREMQFYSMVTPPTCSSTTSTLVLTYTAENSTAVYVPPVTKHCFRHVWKPLRSLDVIII